MISINNISIQFGGEYLFKDISFNINDKDRIGLVGKNGAGKTTLMKLIASHIKPDEGNISYPSDFKIGYLPQEMDLRSDKTIFNEALSAFSEALVLKNNIDTLTYLISKRKDFKSEEYLKLITKLNEVNDRFLLIGGNTMEPETEKILKGLGFTKEEFNRNVEELSGGWKMRIVLAKILLKNPDVILLDEPTNHLDIESIQWLEGFLKNYKGAVILVSHDRIFLDNITNRTIEISLGSIHNYKVSYSEYEKLRALQYEQQLAAYNNQQKQINETEKFISRFRYQATKAKQVQSKIKILKKIDRIQVDKIDKTAVHFSFPEVQNSGSIVVSAEKLSKSFGEKKVLNNLDFVIRRGDFVAFVGKNGEGKSTLSKIITGRLDYKGDLKIGHNVKIGYYAQDSAKSLDQNKTVFETIDDIAVGDIRTKIRNILGGFLFSNDAIDKKVSVLSGGEKSRLALAKLLLTPVNFMVLDEPTNHLDMQTKDILKKALLQYKGTLIIVSHDRDFLHGLCTKVFEFKNHVINKYEGDIFEFIEHKKIKSLKELEGKKVFNSFVSTDKKSENKVRYEKKKELDRNIRRIKNKLKSCENKIEELEKKLKAYDDILADPQSFKDNINIVFDDYNKIKVKLDFEMQRWEDLSIELENQEN
ncbi:MAG: ABC-F family ATP-binding cassette domain-containing protein [Bacteroidales bacterium]|nr:ABC-F family ATP-binding cassette domain-containing protein [Bacteroidales bacterium]